MTESQLYTEDAKDENDRLFAEWTYSPQGRAFLDHMSAIEFVESSKAKQTQKYIIMSYHVDVHGNILGLTSLAVVDTTVQAMNFIQGLVAKEVGGDINFQFSINPTGLRATISLTVSDVYPELDTTRVFSVQQVPMLTTLTTEATCEQPPTQ